MPNIRTFDTPQLGLRPTDEGVRAATLAGYRLGRFYDQNAGSLDQLANDESRAYDTTGRAVGSGIAAAGDAAVNYEDHKEISAGAAAGTTLMANLTDQWNKTVSNPNVDPNDPTIKQKFMQETVEPALEQFKGGFNTEKSQDFADSFINRFRQHMEEKTSADMSTLAGVALKANVQTTVNQLSSMVASDPSSMDFALASADHAISAKVASAPTLRGVEAASVRTEVGLKAKEAIVKSGIIGMIEKNPNVDLDGLQKKYGQYFNGAEMKMFEKQAQVQARTNLAVERQNLLLKRQIADQNMHAGANKVFSDNVSIGQDGRPVINPNYFKQTLELARDNPDAPSGAPVARTMLGWGEGQQKRESTPTDDPATMKDLNDRLFSPDHPTTLIDLIKAHADGLMSDHSFSVMNGMVKELQATPLKGPVYQDTMKAAHDALVLNVPGIPGKDGVGVGNYAKFVQSFVPEYLKAYRAGTLPPNALDIKDPDSMISKMMAPYKRSPQQRMQDYIASAGGLGTTTAAPAAKTASPTVSTQAEYNALPHGATYLGSDGKTYRKP